MVIQRTIKSFQEFIRLESSAGILLCVVAVLALIIDNSPLYRYYNTLLSTYFIIGLGNFQLAKPLILWVNDGLMAIFFFLVGLEIKREILEGELNSLSKAALPGIAALGGMLIPGLIYSSLNWHDPAALKGWAIPMATDIAFSLGILSFLGKRVPSSLKVFLTALAILDDLGAIIIIAMFYTDALSMLSLMFSGFFIIILFFLNRLNVEARAPYFIVGILLWISVLKSGVHATLTGVILAMAIPLRLKDNPNFSPTQELEHKLHPWVAFGVLPIFAFFNAGVPFSGMALHHLYESIPLGIILGLFIGKQLGVFGFSWAAIKLRLAELSENLTWSMLYGVSVLCGIGFTMSLFIGTLAFDTSNIEYARALRVGVLLGSLISGIVGYFILYCITSKNSSDNKIRNSSSD